MLVQKWPEQMPLEMAETYLTYKNSGHQLYGKATLRRMFKKGTLDGKQADKRCKIFIYKSSLDLKLLDRNIS